jgi:hypothetical protein
MAPLILFIGASGGFWSSLVDEFVAQLAGFTDHSKFKFARVSSRGIHIVTGSYTDLKQYAGWYDTVISLAGHTVKRLQSAMIDAAVVCIGLFASEYRSYMGQEAPKVFSYCPGKRVI